MSLTGFRCKWRAVPGAFCITTSTRRFSEIFQTLCHRLLFSFFLSLLFELGNEEEYLSRKGRMTRGKFVTLFNVGRE